LINGDDLCFHDIWISELKILINQQR
jgi:hypothetical protein